MKKLKNLAGAVLIGLGSLGLFNYNNANAQTAQKRVTELSSWPIKGIRDVRYSQGGFVFKTH